MKLEIKDFRRLFQARFWIMLFFCIALATAPEAMAQDEIEEELRAVEQQIDTLRREAEELHEAGQHEKAAALRHRAEDLHAKIEQIRAHQERKKAEGRGELEEILHGLECGMVALEKLGRREELKMLERVADDVRREMAGRRKEKRARSEKEIGLQQIEVMRLAMKAVLEADRKDTAEILEHAIHARELALEGRRDEKAMKIRESAPELGIQVEILFYAADLWDEFGHEGKAARVRELAGQFRMKLERRKGDLDHGEKERDQARRRIEIMKSALAVLREAGKEDAAHILKRATQARIVILEGMEGEEANIVRERNPALKNQVEALGLASRLCHERGNDEKARTIGTLAEQMWAEQKRKDAKALDAEERHIRELEEKMRRMEREIEELKQALREVRRDR